MSKSCFCHLVSCECAHSFGQVREELLNHEREKIRTSKRVRSGGLHAHVQEQGVETSRGPRHRPPDCLKHGSMTSNRFNVTSCCRGASEAVLLNDVVAPLHLLAVPRKLTHPPSLFKVQSACTLCMCGPMSRCVAQYCPIRLCYKIFLPMNTNHFISVNSCEKRAAVQPGSKGRGPGARHHLMANNTSPIEHVTSSQGCASPHLTPHQPIMDTENSSAPEPDRPSNSMPGGLLSTSGDNILNYSSHLTPATSATNGGRDLLLEDSGTGPSSAIDAESYTSARQESTAIHERILHAAELRNRGATAPTLHIDTQDNSGNTPDTSSSASSWSSLSRTHSDRTVSSSSSDARIEEVNDDGAESDDPPPEIPVDPESRETQNGVPPVRRVEAVPAPVPVPVAPPLALEQVNDEPQCRICLAGAEESDELGPLIRPCRCTGTISVRDNTSVHVSSLTLSHEWGLCTRTVCSRSMSELVENAQHFA